MYKLLILFLLPIFLQAQYAVNHGELSTFLRFVPAESVDSLGEAGYDEIISDCRREGTLISQRDGTYRRIEEIVNRILPFTNAYNERVSEWDWEFSVIRSSEINAFCFPAGKIAAYTGLVDGLNLTDDEIAIVIGHEMAHALREHTREEIGKMHAAEYGLAAAVDYFELDKGAIRTVQLGSNLLFLQFSRSNERESDIIGMELAALAGYDPRAAVSLVEKMDAAIGDVGPDWLSTHPGAENRLEVINEYLPLILPLYESGETSTQRTQRSDTEHIEYQPQQSESNESRQIESQPTVEWE